MKTWIKPIAKLETACREAREAIEWAEQYDGLQEAWTQCERGDWMLWLVGRMAKSKRDRQQLALAACACARLALPYVPVGETHPLHAIEITERWARGEVGVTLKMVRHAIAAAYYTINANYAANYAATYAANYVAAHAAYASNAATRISVLNQCADIVRHYYPTMEVK